MQLKSYLRGFGCGLFISAVLMGIALSYSRNTMTDEEIKLRASELGMVEEDSVLVRPSDDKAGTSNALPVVQVNPAGDNKAGETDASEKPSYNNKQETAGNTEEKKEPEKAEEKKESETTEEKKESDKYADEDRLAAMGMNQASDQNKEETETKEETAASTDTKEETVKKPETETEEESAFKSTESYTLEISKGATSDSVARLMKQGGLIDNASDFDSYLCRNGYDKRIQNGVFKIPAGAGYEEIAKIITRSR